MCVPSHAKASIGGRSIQSGSPYQSRMMRPTIVDEHLTITRPSAVALIALSLLSVVLALRGRSLDSDLPTSSDLPNRPARPSAHTNTCRCQSLMSSRLERPPSVLDISIAVEYEPGSSAG